MPQGWTVKGGMFRLGYSDERIMVDINSPEVSIPTYFAPNQFHPEGAVYDLGAQAQGTVARYRTGQEYADLYARARFNGLCKGLTAQGSDSTEPGPGYLPPENTKSSAGQVTYRCQADGGPRIAYVWARTTVAGDIWQVQVASFLAPLDGSGLARQIISAGEQSFKLSPAWLEQQKKNDANALVYQRARQQARLRQLSQQVAQFEMRMQAMQSQVAAFQRGQDRQAKQVESFGNILTGITPTIDPLGNRRDVYTGPKSNYWQNGRGDVINADTSPGPGWQRMRPVQ